jgi:flagellar hook-length control protein FliK
MVAGKEQSATLTLNPPDMGPMQVVLSVTNDQATVSFTAAQPEVRQALENAMPKLREMMSENGIALGNASVNEGSADQRQAQQGEKSRGQGGGNRFGGGGDVAGTAEAPRAARAGGTGLVDTFA